MNGKVSTIESASKLQNLFPDVFQPGVSSVDYEEINVKLVDGGITLTGYFLHTFLLKQYKAKGYDGDTMDDYILVKTLANDKLFISEITSLPLFYVEILYCNNAGNPAGKRDTIAAADCDSAYDILHNRVKKYKSCMKINGGHAERLLK